MSTTMVMEASSPLASMQPPSFYGYRGFRTNAASGCGVYGPTGGMPANFNFRDLSMKRSHSDYFNMPPPVRGSSPTASLAADLSQNMHIDQSPQQPTPRRSLFVAGALGQRQDVTTPPVPSSPVDADGMDTSPLPHKAPYLNTIEIQLQSPSPEKTPITESPVEISPLESNPSVCPPTLQLPTERRRSGPLRPSLARTKGFSTNTVPQRPSPESQLPPFRFGSGVSRPTTSSSLSLSQIFEESPPQERAVSRLPASHNPSPRAHQFTALNYGSRHGSPSHTRKASNSFIRPRKQFRRSMSMYEHPDDVMTQDQEVPGLPALPLVKDFEPAQTLRLPHFASDNQPCDLPRISKETMVDILDGKYDHLYNKRVVIDCRFEYEYEGGHIDGAVNFNDKEQLAAQLFDVEPSSGALLIFHCEYSACRAPRMAKFIRSKDRAVNAENYPFLTYPEVYILDGGYSSFFNDHSSRCFPPSYVEMDAKEHERACELGLGKVMQRSKLTRAQTYAFGQHSPGFESSPTALGRRSRDDDIDMDLGNDFTPIAPRATLESMRARPNRMCSY